MENIVLAIASGFLLGITIDIVIYKIKQEYHKVQAKKAVPYIARWLAEQEMRYLNDRDWIWNRIVYWVGLLTMVPF